MKKIGLVLAFYSMLVITGLAQEEPTIPVSDPLYKPGERIEGVKKATQGGSLSELPYLTGTWTNDNEECLRITAFTFEEPALNSGRLYITGITFNDSDGPFGTPYTWTLPMSFSTVEKVRFSKKNLKVVYLTLSGENQDGFFYEYLVKLYVDFTRQMCGARILKATALSFE